MFEGRLFERALDFFEGAAVDRRMRGRMKSRKRGEGNDIVGEGCCGRKEG